MPSINRPTEVRLGNEEVAIDYDGELEIVGVYIFSEFYQDWFPIDLKKVNQIYLDKFKDAVKLDDEINEMWVTLVEDKKSL